MAIKNYTTSIAAEKTISEIQQALVKHKTKSVLVEWDDNGIATHVSFQIPMPHGMQSFRLPANIDRVFICLQRSKGVAPKLRTREQAARVAWRIIKDWVEAQLAIVEAEMISMVEVFLPYAQNDEGKTIAERFNESPTLLLK